MHQKSLNLDLERHVDEKPVQFHCFEYECYIFFVQVILIATALVITIE
jgi:hypothetical protein